MVGKVDPVGQTRIGAPAQMENNNILLAGAAANLVGNVVSGVGKALDSNKREQVAEEAYSELEAAHEEAVSILDSQEHEPLEGEEELHKLKRGLEQERFSPAMYQIKQHKIISNLRKKYGAKYADTLLASFQNHSVTDGVDELFAEQTAKAQLIASEEKLAKEYAIELGVDPAMRERSPELFELDMELAIKNLATANRVKREAEIKAANGTLNKEDQIAMMEQQVPAGMDKIRKGLNDSLIEQTGQDLYSLSDAILNLDVDGDEIKLRMTQWYAEKGRPELTRSLREQTMEGGINESELSGIMARYDDYYDALTQNVGSAEFSEFMTEYGSAQTNRLYYQSPRWREVSVIGKILNMNPHNNPMSALTERQFSTKVWNPMFLSLMSGESKVIGGANVAEDAQGRVYLPAGETQNMNKYYEEQGILEKRSQQAYAVDMAYHLRSQMNDPAVMELEGAQDVIFNWFHAQAQNYNGEINRYTMQSEKVKNAWVDAIADPNFIPIADGASQGMQEALGLDMAQVVHSVTQRIYTRDATQHIRNFLDVQTDGTNMYVDVPYDSKHAVTMESPRIAESGEYPSNAYESFIGRLEDKFGKPETYYTMRDIVDIQATPDGHIEWALKDMEEFEHEIGFELPKAEIEKAKKLAVYLNRQSQESFDRLIRANAHSSAKEYRTDYARSAAIIANDLKYGINNGS